MQKKSSSKIYYLDENNQQKKRNNKSNAKINPKQEISYLRITQKNAIINIT